MSQIGNFFSGINNESNCEKIVLFLKNQMKEQPQDLLTIDIIDYIIDNGCPKIINLIAQKNFLDCFLNLLKSETNEGIENQKNVIYLTQKWANKFSNNNNLKIFQDNYNLLKGYNKFIGGNQNNNNPNNNNNQNNNNLNNYNQNNIQNNKIMEQIIILIKTMSII